MIRFVRVAVVVLAAWLAAVGVPRTADAARSPVEVPTVTVGDSDGDGLPEVSSSGMAGGPCACRCPIVGGEIGAEAAGLAATSGARSALVVCGTRTAAAVDPGAPDASGAPRAGGRLRVNPNGLGDSLAP